MNTIDIDLQTLARLHDSDGSHVGLADSMFPGIHATITDDAIYLVNNKTERVLLSINLNLIGNLQYPTTAVQRERQDVIASLTLRRNLKRVDSIIKEYRPPGSNVGHRPSSTEIVIEATSYLRMIDPAFLHTTRPVMDVFVHSLYDLLDPYNVEDLEEWRTGVWNDRDYRIDYVEFLLDLVGYLDVCRMRGDI